jgi:predicted dehydrogenase
VEETGLVYALGETSYYRPQTIYCRERFAQGEFGEFVYGEGHYYHDMASFYRFFHFSGGNDWKRTASFPPMLYPTHSVSHVLGVTFRRMTEVSCFGFEDRHPDRVFDPEKSLWKNPFSNESGLFRTSDGGMARINEMRRIAAGESRGTIMGTLGAYEEQAKSAVWSELRIPEHDWSKGDPDTYKFMDDTKRESEDVQWIRELPGVEITEDNLGPLPRSFIGKRHLDVGSFHPVQRLPAEFVGLPNKHAGSHQFIVVDFMDALATGKLPPNNVWQAARYNAPGIVAHQSAMKGGELLKIPDFGKPPADAVLMDPLSVLRD